MQFVTDTPFHAFDLNTSPEAELLRNELVNCRIIKRAQLCRVRGLIPSLIKVNYKLKHMRRVFAKHGHIPKIIFCRPILPI